MGLSITLVAYIGKMKLRTAMANHPFAKPQLTFGAQPPRPSTTPSAPSSPAPDPTPEKPKSGTPEFEKLIDDLM